MTEAQIVRQCKQYLDLLRCAGKLEYRIVHIPNPRFSSWKEKDHARTMAGHADCEVYLPGGRVLHIEFKTETGKQRPAQKQWQKDLEAIGHKYHIVRGEVALVTILRHAGIPRHSWLGSEIKEDFSDPI